MIKLLKAIGYTLVIPTTIILWQLLMNWIVNNESLKATGPFMGVFGALLVVGEVAWVMVKLMDLIDD